jgi:competence CoiA-like predicted nuclease
MIWAINHKVRIKAEPKREGYCPLCEERLIPKCGMINRWHWSHKSFSDCDTWGEGETEWHLEWKQNFPSESQEISIQNHRADIFLKHKGLVIELQNSPIQMEEIREREEFYKHMIWILNGESLCKGIQICKDKGGYFTFKWKNPNKNWWGSKKPIYVDLSGREDEILKELENYENGKRKYETISYEVENDWGDNTHWESEKVDVTKEEIRNLTEELYFLQQYGKILLIKKIHCKTPCFGWGYLIKKEEFIKKLK